VAALLCAAAAHGSPRGGSATYYVDSRTGDDSRSGTSPASAWRSLGRVAAAHLRGGDRVLLRRGSVWPGGFELAASGTRGRPVLVAPYGRGARPLVRGGSTCVTLAGSFLRLTAIEARDCTWAGVSVSGSFDRVEGSSISRNAAGIVVVRGSHGNALVENTISHNDRMSVLTKTPTDDDSGAFGILLQGDDTYVAHNRIVGSDAFSYDYGRDGSAIEIYGGRDNVIAWNVAADDHSFSELGDARTSDNTFAYNLFTSSASNATFVVTRGGADARGPVRETRLYNNTAVLTGQGSDGVVCYAGCGPTILQLRNNIVVARHNALFADGNAVEDHNVFSGSVVEPARGVGTVIGAPEFVNAAASDFELARSSPAVDRGVAVGYRRDLAGARVPVDGNGDGTAAPDAGCFEYQGR
jgi:parallel beta-helix repeat protein